MAYDAEGTIYVPLEDFWEWIMLRAPGGRGGQIRFGVPQVDAGNAEIRVSFAVGTEDHPPDQWSVKPPAVTEWEDLRKGGQS